MVTTRQTLADRAKMAGRGVLLLCAWAVAGCATSADLEQIRQGRNRGRARCGRT